MISSEIMWADDMESRRDPLKKVGLVKFTNSDGESAIVIREHEYGMVVWSSNIDRFPLGHHTDNWTFDNHPSGKGEWENFNGKLTISDEDDIIVNVWLLKHPLSSRFWCAANKAWKIQRLATYFVTEESAIEHKKEWVPEAELIKLSGSS